ncbi:hypothetical protein D5F01_LYC21481 [Larimichthys crocea]|uniref:Uncharacterized protein n=1 Tax=Larimichthys crocea TaxID=215358 RepID=A0A6G0HPH5_LARCR|nr:hypothetical protein D5F01_LYC21481 [Larimichthys crocea]
MIRLSICLKGSPEFTKGQQKGSSLSSVEEVMEEVESRFTCMEPPAGLVILGTVSFTVSAPWFTPALRLMKAKGRQLERLHRKTGLTIHKEMYKNHMSLYKDSITSTKTHYYSGIITANQGNSKTLFSLLNNITQPQDSLPSHCYTTTFCNSIMSFFTEKIKNIHQQLGSIPHLNISTDWHPPTHPFPTFHLPSLSEIAELIKQSKPSTCQLDPLPHNL